VASVSLRPPGELASGPKIIKLNRAQFGYRLAVIAFGDEVSRLPRVSRVRRSWAMGAPVCTQRSVRVSVCVLETSIVRFSRSRARSHTTGARDSNLNLGTGRCNFSELASRLH